MKHALSLFLLLTVFSLSTAIISPIAKSSSLYTSTPTSPTTLNSPQFTCTIAETLYVPLPCSKSPSIVKNSAFTTPSSHYLFILQNLSQESIPSSLFQFQHTLTSTSNFLTFDTLHLIDILQEEYWNVGVIESSPTSLQMGESVFWSADGWVSNGVFPGLNKEEIMDFWKGLEGSTPKGDGSGFLVNVGDGDVDVSWENDPVLMGEVAYLGKMVQDAPALSAVFFTFFAPGDALKNGEKKKADLFFSLFHQQLEGVADVPYEILVLGEEESGDKAKQKLANAGFDVSKFPQFIGDCASVKEVIGEDANLYCPPTVLPQEEVEETSEEDVAMFQLILLTAIVLVLSIFFSIWVLFTMDTKKDTLLFRTPLDVQTNAIMDDF